MRRLLRSALLLVALALLAPAGVSAAEYTVTTASDNELDNNCAAPCSLHQAITEANQIEGEDVIRFSIGLEGSTATIADTGAVPMAQITEAVTIDGWSQGAGDYAGPPLVELAGPGPFAGSPGLRITTTGGDTTIRGLAINGFQGAGIQVEGSGATIAGNYIGTSLDGMADDGNGGWGVDGGFGDDVTVGGDQPAEGNLISGNDQGGVSFDSAERPVIRGNRIGLNAAGTATIPNNGSGVNLNGDTRGAVVGGLTPTPGVAPGNVIVGSTVNNGIAANNSFDTQPPVIQGNTIGTNVAGAAGMGNTGAGVFGNDRVLVGTGGPSARNVISGNTGAGVMVEETSTVANSTIGLTPDGTTDLGNGGAGVDLHAPATVTANRIGGNAGWGVTASSLAPGTVVEGNTIGTNAARTLARPNDAGGVNLDGVENGIVRDNHIAGHTGAAPNAGLRLDEVVNASVHGNRIGLNGAGSGAIPNTRGILFSGLSAQTVIGPSAAGHQPNTISGNGVGIRSETSGAQPNTIASNRIGTNVAGTQAVPNTGDGIAVAGGTDDLSILRNAIAHNGGLGIDLADDGVTVNDAGDIDGGPNGRQNHPTVTEAAAGGGRTTARGRIEALPGKAYRIEVFRSAACDPSGSGEGATYLGAAETTTNGAGDATWSLDVTGTPTQPGEVVTATATARATPGGQTQDTSELSPCATAAALPDEGGPEPVDKSGTGDQTEPTPEAQRTAGAEVVSGRVTVTLPDGRVITLTGAEEIPMGSKVDTTQGRVKITAAGTGENYVAEFTQGAFVITQDANRLVDLKVAGAVGPCPKARAGKAGPRAGAAAARRKRRLWGKGRGRFRTSGRHSASVVKGTTWLVEDSCAGTRTTVDEGVVRVADYAQGIVSDVRAGTSRLVPPRPLPKLGSTFNVVRVGKQARTQGGGKLKPFQQVRGIPKLDATRGAVRIVTRSGSEPVNDPELGRLPTYWSTFDGGRFSVRQRRSGLADVKLLGALSCPKGTTAQASARKRKRRRLFGSGRGRFRTSGKHSAAVVKGTRWLVEDTCAGTLTRVFEGVVEVEDFVKRTTVDLRAGERYLAKPRRRR